MSDLPTWADRAACTGHDPDLWFPTSADTSPEAVAICVQCPVRVACLEHAVTRPEKHGIWGGLTTAERKPLTAPTRYRRRPHPSRAANPGLVLVGETGTEIR